MEKRHLKLKRLEWIARLKPDNCPGGVPQDDRAWRDLVNRIVLEVRPVLSDLPEESDESDRSDQSDTSDGLGGRPTRSK